MMERMVVLGRCVAMRLPRHVDYSVRESNTTRVYERWVGECVCVITDRSCLSSSCSSAKVLCCCFKIVSL